MGAARRQTRGVSRRTFLNRTSYVVHRQAPPASGRRQAPPPSGQCAHALPVLPAQRARISQIVHRTSYLVHRHRQVPPSYIEVDSPPPHRQFAPPGQRIRAVHTHLPPAARAPSSGPSCVLYLVHRQAPPASAFPPLCNYARSRLSSHRARTCFAEFARKRGNFPNRKS